MIADNQHMAEHIELLKKQEKVVSAACCFLKIPQGFLHVPPGGTQKPIELPSGDGSLRCSTQAKANDPKQSVKLSRVRNGLRCIPSQLEVGENRVHCS